MLSISLGQTSDVSKCWHYTFSRLRGERGYCVLEVAESMNAFARTSYRRVDHFALALIEPTCSRLSALSAASRFRFSSHSNIFIHNKRVDRRGVLYRAISEVVDSTSSLNCGISTRLAFAEFARIVERESPRDVKNTSLRKVCLHCDFISSLPIVNHPNYLFAQTLERLVDR